MKHVLLILALSLPLAGEDWPQFLGPRRNGTYISKDLAAQWPADGPKVLWRKKVGNGWGGAVVAGNRIVHFHRDGQREVIECSDAVSGKTHWKYGYISGYVDQFGKDNGPRATPAIAGDRVYTMGASGIVTVLDLMSGKAIWHVNTQKQYKANLGFFGIACSPLIHDKQVLLNIGGENGAGIIALDINSGKLRWKTSNDNTSYSSPILTTLEGKQQALFFTRAGLESVEPNTGRTLFTFPWRPAINASVNAATPIVSGNLIFISTSYSKGAALLAVKDNRTETLWARDGVMSNQYATCVLHGDHLYGFHGRADGGNCELRCVELKTGKMKWSHPGLRSGTVILAGKELLILTERGELLRAPADSTTFRPTARAQILGFTVRAYPALANGCLYARDNNNLVCVDLRASQ